MQIDEVKNIPCGTKGGVLINVSLLLCVLICQFEKIEVVNRLEESLVIPTIRNYTGAYDKIWIYDKIHHEINQYCSSHSLKEIFIDNFSDIDDELISSLKKTIQKFAPGINIISVRVTKPIIPQVIEESFVKIESTKARVAGIVQENLLKVQQTKALIEADLKKKDSDKQALKIDLDLKIKQIKSKLEMFELECQMNKLKRIGILKSQFESKAAEIRSIIDQYGEDKEIQDKMFELMETESLLNNSRIAIGTKIPGVQTFDVFEASKNN